MQNVDIKWTLLKKTGKSLRIWKKHRTFAARNYTLNKNQTEK